MKSIDECFDIVKKDYLKFLIKEKIHKKSMSIYVKNLKKIYIPKILVNMRVGGMSNKSFKNLLKKSIEDFKIIKKNKIGGIFTLINKNYSKLNQFLN